MITSEMMQTAMQLGLGPLEGEFETPELKAIHDLWIDGGNKIREAQERMDKLIPAEAIA